MVSFGNVTMDCPVCGQAVDVEISTEPKTPNPDFSPVIEVVAADLVIGTVQVYAEWDHRCPDEPVRMAA